MHVEGDFFIRKVSEKYRIIKMEKVYLPFQILIIEMIFFFILQNKLSVLYVILFSVPFFTVVLFQPNICDNVLWKHLHHLFEYKENSTIKIIIKRSIILFIKIVLELF